MSSRPAPFIVASLLITGAVGDAGTTRGGGEVETPAANIFGVDDEAILAALAHAPIAEVERGGGGRSLSFEITLEGGTVGYFKPEQAFDGMRWSAEIAAYHFDRELGLGRVAPTVGRRIAWRTLRPAAAGDWRTDELQVDEDGTLRGAFVWWVPEPLIPLSLPDGWAQWLRVEGEPDAITPFQRPSAYRDARAAGGGGAAADPGAPERPDRVAELSDLIVFDYLIHNLDRWGSQNTNVRTVGPEGPLMFLDNAASFTLPRPRIALSDTRLHHVQRFRRSTIDAIRRFDRARFEARLRRDPLAPALSARQLDNLEQRRRHLLAYIDQLVETHGEDTIYPW